MTVDGNYMNFISVNDKDVLKNQLILYETCLKKYKHNLHMC